MKRDSDEVEKSVDATYYVEIGTEGHKDAGRKASDWSMVVVVK